MAEKKPERVKLEIIGSSPQIKDVLATARRIAQSPTTTILIVGESGTGKELVARLIHDSNPTTANQPFIDLNCGAIPETLLESELFGYEQGAFTGAHRRKVGLFEFAAGGTIFLDEIGNTTTNFQSKLLKVVETKTFRRLNGVGEISVSTRILAATNADLFSAISAGKFREDLFYRLNVCPIYLPPLRERGDDALTLAEHFLDTFRDMYNRNVIVFSDEAKQFILDYHWPGNIRQLKNAIERAVLAENSTVIDSSQLMVDSKREPFSKATATNQPHNTIEASDSQLPFEFPPEGIDIEEMERRLLLAALRHSGGNISKAARLLKINRGKLRYRLKKFGVSPRSVAVVDDSKFRFSDFQGANSTSNSRYHHEA